MTDSFNRCYSCDRARWHCDCIPCPGCSELIEPWEKTCAHCKADAEAERKHREEEERDGGR